MEFFVEVVNGWKLLNIFAESSILDIWPGSESAFDKRREQELGLQACQLIADQFFVLLKKYEAHATDLFLVLFDLYQISLFKVACRVRVAYLKE